MVDLTRRSFLKGMAGVAVIATLPAIVHVTSGEPIFAEAAPPPVEPVPPDGITYNWVRTALLGEPDIQNVEDRIARGWTFVKPSAHPEMHTEKTEVVFENGGLILMEKPTVEVWRSRYEEQMRHPFWSPLSYNGHSSPRITVVRRGSHDAQ